MALGAATTWGAGLAGPLLAAPMLNAMTGLLASGSGGPAPPASHPVKAPALPVNACQGYTVRALLMLHGMSSLHSSQSQGNMSLAMQMSSELSIPARVMHKPSLQALTLQC